MSRRRIALAAAAFAVFASGGCRRDKKPVTLTTIEGPSTVLPAPSATTTGIAATRTSVQVIEGSGESHFPVNGAKREYVLVEPAALDGTKRYPLVLVFHGDGGGAANFHRAFPFEKASGADAIVAYPDGINATWDLDTKFDNREVKFVEAIIAQIAGRFPIDDKRIFAAGYSSGGFLSNIIACQRHGLFRAIASSAGGAPYKQAMLWPNGYTRCLGQEHVAMLALHGEDDHAVTLESGRFSAAYWAYVNGCKTEEIETTFYKECRAYRGCPSGKAVAFCQIPGLGHWVWDRAAEASWTFFLTL